MTSRGRASILALALAGGGLMACRAAAQQPERPRLYGVTAQAYPAGLIVAGRASFPFHAKSTLTAYAGYNFTDRRDFGEHDDEAGGGPGFGLAVRRYVSERYDGFHYGVRTDVWFLGIDWQDVDGPRSGTTNIVVLQPTAQAGYDRTVAGGRLVLGATIALGVEINIDTAGEAVGEGPIFLVGLGIAHR